MSPKSRTVLERLGPEGLERALDDLLDGARLARLANACGVSYPGMRTRKQSRGRLLADVVRKAREDQAAAREVVRQLSRETAARRKTLAARPPEDVVREWSDPAFEPTDGEVGAAAFLVASDQLAVPPDLLATILSRAGRPTSPGNGGRPSGDGRAAGTRRGAPRPADDDRERARLEKRRTELERKVRHQNEQLRKLRESDKALRRDLMERRGELAESRMTVERLRKQLEAATRAPSPAEQETAMTRGLDTVARAVRRVGTRQRKIGDAIEQLRERLDRRDASDASAPDPADLAGALDGVAKDLAAERRASRKAEREMLRRLDEIGSRIDSLGERLDGLASGRAARRPARGKPRVGVFIDVQNVFYGARQLKGKLDFDALMQAAVRGRRLVLALAYVVESKEIDQSGFIAVLEHRSIRVRRKNLRVRADGSMKGDWDMEIALDILDAVRDLDVVVLVSGDGDFTSLVRRVKGIGPRVEVMSFPRTASKALVDAADHFQPLDRKFMIRSGPVEAPEEPTGGSGPVSA